MENGYISASSLQEHTNELVIGDPEVYSRISATTFECPDDVDEALICCICDGLSMDVVNAGCGNQHLFCRNCLLGWLARANSCPTCQKSISAETLVPLSERKMIEVAETRVVCESCYRWTGPLRQLQQHTNECLSNVISHSNGYTVTVPSIDGASENLPDISSRVIVTELESPDRMHTLEKLILEQQNTIEQMQLMNIRLEEILRSCNPREYCLEFEERIPRLLAFASGGVQAMEGSFVEEYDFLKQRWIVKAMMPIQCQEVSDFCLLPRYEKNNTCNTIYLIGGRILLKANGKSSGKAQNGGFSSKPKKWFSLKSRRYQKPPLNHEDFLYPPHDDIASTRSSDSLAVGCFPSYKSSAQKRYPSERIMRGCSVYSVPEEKWKDLPSLCYPRFSMVGVEIDRTLCVFGGLRTSNGLTYHSFEILYNTAKSWTAYGYPPFISRIISAASFKGRIFLLYEPTFSALAVSTGMSRRGEGFSTSRNFTRRPDPHNTSTPSASLSGEISTQGQHEQAISSEIDYRTGDLADVTQTLCCTLDIHGELQKNFLKAWKEVPLPCADLFVAIEVIDDSLYIGGKSASGMSNKLDFTNFCVYLEDTQTFCKVQTSMKRSLERQFASCASCHFPLDEKLSWVCENTSSNRHVAFWDS